MRLVQLVLVRVPTLIDLNWKYGRMVRLNLKKRLGTASKILIDHLRFISGISEEAFVVGTEKESSVAVV